MVGFRKSIVRLATRHKLPAIYMSVFLWRRAGYLSYGPNLVDATRRRAGYVVHLQGRKARRTFPVQAHQTNTIWSSI